MVSEGLDVHFMEENDFGVADFSALNAYLIILSDGDLSLIDLGGNLECVEEGDLRRVHACRTGGN